MRTDAVEQMQPVYGQVPTALRAVLITVYCL